MIIHDKNSVNGFSMLVKKIASVWSTEFFEEMSKAEIKLLAQ